MKSTQTHKIINNGKRTRFVPKLVHITERLLRNLVSFRNRFEVAVKRFTALQRAR